MNRMEEIRERYAPGTVVKLEFEYINQALSDLIYLLARVEKLEGALNDIEKYGFAKNTENLDKVMVMRGTAKQALREDEDGD